MFNIIASLIFFSTSCMFKTIDQLSLSGKYFVGILQVICLFICLI